MRIIAPQSDKIDRASNNKSNIQKRTQMFTCLKKALETIAFCILEYNKTIRLIVIVDTINLSGTIYQISSLEGINTRLAH